MKTDILQQWIDAELTVGELLDCWGCYARSKTSGKKEILPAQLQNKTFLTKKFLTKSQEELIEEMMALFRTNHSYYFDVLKERYCLRKLKVTAADNNDLNLAIREFKYFFTEFVELNFKDLKEQEI